MSHSYMVLVGIVRYFFVLVPKDGMFLLLLLLSEAKFVDNDCDHHRKVVMHGDGCDAILVAIL